jgi:hypothetical protein
MNDLQDIVCLACTPNRATARAWRDALNAAGIECEVGECLATWLSSGPRTESDLWVRRTHLERAREVLVGRISIVERN